MLNTTILAMYTKELPSVVPDKPNLPGDSKLYLSVIDPASQKTLGFSGISFGLSDYYDGLLDDDYKYMPNDVLDQLERAKRAADGKWIITQMQSCPDTHDERKETNFRKVLMNAWRDVAESTQQPIDLLLPARINYWELRPVQQRMADQYYDLPTENSLLMNYDYTAKRHGFAFNPSSGLFERKVKKRAPPLTDA